MYRLFVALDLPPEIRQQLQEISGYGIQGASWVVPENIHLTLKFIGEVDGGQLEDISGSLSEIRFTAFEMKLKGTGCFPPKGEPRSLWAGVEDDSALAHLARKIDQRLVRQGIPREARKFSPHVTLARLKASREEHLVSFLTYHSLFQSSTFTVNEFVLFASVRTPRGSVYQKLRTYRSDQADLSSAPREQPA
ncbi:MAG: RNA 2',3'-cyclic phosphodiesterase [SAR324 cluster bacterium]|nr:RNA 2',3'-cyclic phosphodiesterase [SAR324 cluster bacterium]